MKKRQAKAIVISITAEEEYRRRQYKRNVALLSALFGLSGILYTLALIQM
ncbi:hypothetical protein [Commensalibacter oyaizuii]|uniref:Uncharacterized protein n=1 Tax=Commensalibacter oyaizuii TaxID=3043873 RepID=A0ABT6PYR5_9PROT|nr:hypothetical protein [Commensalibacter sp. TBRC 16381]MDI2089997.1 hypothetical protein [Commensalibacter sp. TBRC 16381]